MIIMIKRIQILILIKYRINNKSNNNKSKNNNNIHTHFITKTSHIVLDIIYKNILTILKSTKTIQ